MQHVLLGGQQVLPPQHECDGGQQRSPQQAWPVGQHAKTPVSTTPHAVVPGGQAHEPSGLHVAFGGQHFPTGFGGGGLQQTEFAGQHSSAPGVGDTWPIPQGLKPGPQGGLHG